MRLTVRHRTSYVYSEPVRHSVHYLRASARSSALQRVLDWRVTAPGSLAPWTDHFDNHCHTLTVDGPADAIAVEAAGTVETVETGGILPFDAAELPLAVYGRGTAYTRLDDRLRDFAEAHRAALAADLVAGVHELMVEVAAAVRYDTGASHVHTTAAEALAEGAGVCQDHAHVLIAACRHLGVAARYVSGYLWTGGGRESHAASHGWAEVAVPALGWVSLDPANGRSATERYLRIAVGFDYADIAPVRGIRRGGGEESLEVTIELHGQQ